MKGGSVVPNPPMNAFPSSVSDTGINKSVSVQILLADKTSGGSKGNKMLWMIFSHSMFNSCGFTTLFFP